MRPLPYPPPRLTTAAPTPFASTSTERRNVLNTGKGSTRLHNVDLPLPGQHLS